MHDFAEQAEVAKGCKRLLATILYQALVDQGLAQDGVSFLRGTWPWNGEWTPQEELATFWDSDWLENICEWLDMNHNGVLDFVQGIRDGTETIETDKRRVVRPGGSGPAIRPNGSRQVDHARDAAYRQLELWEAS